MLTARQFWEKVNSGLARSCREHDIGRLEMVMVVSTAGIGKAVRFDSAVCGWETGRSEAEEKAIRARSKQGSESADAYREAILAAVAADMRKEGRRRA
jgi:hypothetical protein